MILRFYTVLNGGAICCADYVVSSHIVEGIVYYEHSPCYVAHVVSSHGHIAEGTLVCGRGVCGQLTHRTGYDLLRAADSCRLQSAVLSWLPC